MCRVFKLQQVCDTSKFFCFLGFEVVLHDFERTTDLIYPTIASPNSITISWCYSANIALAGIAVIPGDAIFFPNSAGLFLPIYHDTSMPVEGAFCNPLF